MADPTPKVVHPKDPRRVYCPGCDADISRVCSWFIIAIAGTVQRVNIHPHVCPECNSPINPQLPAVIRPPRPS